MRSVAPARLRRAPLRLITGLVLLLTSLVQVTAGASCLRDPGAAYDGSTMQPAGTVVVQTAEGGAEHGRAADSPAALAVMCGSASALPVETCVGEPITGTAVAEASSTAAAPLFLSETLFRPPRLG